MGKEHHSGAPSNETLETFDNYMVNPEGVYTDSTFVPINIQHHDWAEDPERKTHRIRLLLGR